MGSFDENTDIQFWTQLFQGYLFTRFYAELVHVSANDYCTIYFNDLFTFMSLNELVKRGKNTAKNDKNVKKQKRIFYVLFALTYSFSSQMHQL